MKYIFVLLLLIELPLTGVSQDCNSLPGKYPSYDAAIEAIKTASFSLKESISTPESSWVKGASYFSCSGETGYFILETYRQEYVHQKVPVEVWQQFKKADSFGGFYTGYIKDRYQVFKY